MPEYKLLQRYFEQGIRLTPKQTSQLIGVGLTSSRAYLRLLRKVRFIYVCDWISGALGPPQPIYCLDKFGDNDDEPKPKPLTDAERHSRMKFKRKLKNERTTD